MPSEVVQRLIQDLIILREIVRNHGAWIKWSLGFSVGTFMLVAGALLKYVMH